MQVSKTEINSPCSYPLPRILKDIPPYFSLYMHLNVSILLGFFNGIKICTEAVNCIKKSQGIVTIQTRTVVTSKEKRGLGPGGINRFWGGSSVLFLYLGVRMITLC